VIINDSPKNGRVESVPSQGIALSTQFTFRAPNWVDEDFPIGYQFYLQSEPPLNVNANLKPLNVEYTPVQKVESDQVPQGAVDENYQVKLIVVVKDILGATSSAKGFVTVTMQPPDGMTVADLTASVLKEKIAAAQAAGNTDEQVAIIGGTTAATNLPASCSPQNANSCAALNRESCTRINDLCGPCIDGYETLLGYEFTNRLCETPSQRRLRRLASAGEACTINSDCTYNLCNTDGVCELPQKPCPTAVEGAACSGNGTCIYMDHKAEAVFDCKLDNADCFAYCQCDTAQNGGIPMYGGECTYNNASFHSISNFRRDTCAALIETISNAEINVNSLNTVMENLASSYKPHEMLPDAFEKCNEAVALAFIIINDPGQNHLASPNSNANNKQIAADIISGMLDYFVDTHLYDIANPYIIKKHQWDGYNMTLSNMLAAMTNEDTKLMFKLSQALQYEMGESMVVDQDDIVVLSDHLRLSSRYVSKSTLHNAVIQPPQTVDQDSYNHLMTELVLGQEGFDRCIESSETTVKYGILEWGINPTGASNYTERGIESELVQLTTVCLLMNLI
jgi:hypothetical protein